MGNIPICETFTCIGIPKHWRLSWFRYETFITFLTFRFSTRERETQFLLCWQFHLTPPCMAHLVDLALPRLKNQLASSRFKSQLTAFFQKLPKIFGPSLPGMMSFTSPVPFPIRGFYYDIFDCHMNTCAQCMPYPCTKPNSSKPN